MVIFTVHRYPQCLHFLELLQDERFRKLLADPRAIDFIHTQQFYHWRFYRANRQHQASNETVS